jgi:hypothetical protein
LARLAGLASLSIGPVRDAVGAAAKRAARRTRTSALFFWPLGSKRMWANFEIHRERHDLLTAQRDSRSLVDALSLRIAFGKPA